MRPDHLPKCVDMLDERCGFWQGRFEMPRVITIGWRSRTAALSLAMGIRRLDSKLLADCFEWQIISMNPERRAVGKVGWLVRLFAVNSAPQGSKRPRFLGI